MEPNPAAASNNDIMVAQLNCRKGAKALTNLLKMVTIEDKRPRPKFDLLLLTEPPFNNKSKTVTGAEESFRTIVCKNGPSRAMAAIIILDSAIQTTTNEGALTPYYVEVTLELKPSRVTVACAYIPDESSLEPNTDTKAHILDCVQRHHQTALIVAGDFNAHHPAWESGHTENPNGTWSWNLIGAHALTLLNTRNVPTYLYRTKEFKTDKQGNTLGEYTYTEKSSVIDLTITNSRGVALARKWEVINTDSKSDHRIITFTIGIGGKRTNTTTRYTQGVPNAAVARKCSTLLNTLKPAISDVDTLCKVITETKNSLTSNQHAKKDKFFGKELFELRHRLNHASKNVLNLRRKFNWKGPTANGPRQLEAAMKEKTAARRAYRTCLDNARNKYHRELTKHLGDIWKRPEFSQNTSKFIHKLRRLNEDGNWESTEDQSLMVKWISESIFHPPSTDHPWTPPTLIDNELTSTPGEDSLSAREIDIAVDMVKNDKATGLDGISIKLVKELHKRHPSILHTALGDMYLKAKYSGSLKDIKLTLIKKSTDWCTEVDKLRPIGVANSIMKVYEQALVNKLMYWINRLGLLHPNQFAHRKNISIDDLHDQITAPLVAHRTNTTPTTYSDSPVHTNTRIAAIDRHDVAKAFDSLPHQSIIHTLIKAAIPSKLVAAIADQLADRNVHFQLQEESHSHTMTIGTIQGSALSPLLFELTMSPLLYQLDKALEESNLGTYKSKVFTYADDIISVTWVDNKQRNPSWGSHLKDFTAKRVLVKNEIKKWLASRGLRLDENKSGHIYLPRGPLKHTLLTLKDQIQSEELEMAVSTQAQHPTDGPSNREILDLLEASNEQHLKILGYWYSRDLNSSHHWKVVCTQAKESLHELRGRKWSYRMPFRKLLIQQLALSKIWCITEPARHDTNLNLDYAQITLALGARLCLDIDPVTSKMEALTMAGLPPARVLLELRLRMNTHKRHGIDYEGNHYELIKRADWRNRIHPSKLPAIERLPDIRGQSDQPKPKNHRVVIYTDASLSPDTGGGLAMAEIESGRYMRISTHGLTNSFELEAQAVLQAIRNIDYLAGNKPFTEVIIISDCMGVISALCNTNNQHPTIVETKLEAAYLEARGISLNIAWIRGHSGLEGNERADQEARKARRDLKNPDEIALAHLDIPIPVNKVRSLITKDLETIWVDEYRSKVKEPFVSYFPSPLDPMLKRIRFDYSTAAFYTSQAQIFNLNNWRGQSKNNPTGAWCECYHITGNKVDQTACHLLYSCPFFKELRSNVCHETDLDPSLIEGSCAQQTGKLKQIHSFIKRMAPAIAKELKWRRASNNWDLKAAMEHPNVNRHLSQSTTGHTVSYSEPGGESNQTNVDPTEHLNCPCSE